MLTSASTKTKSVSNASSSVLISGDTIGQTGVGLVLDTSGRLYVAKSGTPGIYLVNPSSGVSTLVSSDNVARANAIFGSAQSGVLYYQRYVFTQDDIYAVGGVYGSTPSYIGTVSPSTSVGFCVDQSGTKVYTVETYGSGGNLVSYSLPAVTSRTVLASGAGIEGGNGSCSSWCDLSAGGYYPTYGPGFVDRNGNVLMVPRGSYYGYIYVVNGQTRTKVSASTYPGGAIFGTIDSTGASPIYYICNITTGSIYRLNVGGDTLVYSAGVNIGGIAFDPVSKQIYVNGASSIYAVSPVY